MADYRRLTISEIPVTVVHFVDSSLSDLWVGMGDDALRDPRGQIHQVSEELQRLVDEGRTHLILNFCNVEFMSTTMYGELLRLRKKLIAAKGTLTLTNLNACNMDVLKVLSLDKVFNIRADEAAALSSL